MTIEDKVQEFLTKLAELQDEYDMYIVSETEEELVVSSDGTASTNSILAYTGDTVVQGFSDACDFDEVNLKALEEKK